MRIPRLHHDFLCKTCWLRWQAPLFVPLLYQFAVTGLSPAAARALFLVLIASIHALFLGVARI